MKNKCRRRDCYGTVESYSYRKKHVILHLSCYDGNGNRKNLAYKIPVWSLNHRLQNLPIFRKDGSLDFRRLEGMPVCIEVIQRGSKIFVKKVVCDVSYYGVGRGNENG